MRIDRAKPRRKKNNFPGRCLLTLWIFLLLSIGRDAEAETPNEDKWAIESLLERERNRGAPTQALLVLREGQITYEGYWNEFTPHTKHILFSVSKSVMSLAVGLAIADQYPNTPLPDLLKESICALISPPRNPELCQASIENVLQMSSGLSWKEGYDDTPEDSNVLEMLYGQGTANMAAYVGAQPLASPPGSTFNYSSGDTMLLGEILRHLTQNSAREFVKKQLFEPVGITDFVWEEDHAGTLIGAAQLYLTARDTARIGHGLLVTLRGGPKEKPWSLPQGFLERSLTPASYEQKSLVPYGYQWWLNQDGNEKALRWPRATPKSFAALGHWGQMIFVVPEEDLVIVRFGEDKLTPFNIDKLVGVVRSSFKQGRGTPLQRARSDLFSRTPLPYERTLLNIAGFAAQGFCSCRYVSQHSFEKCASFITISGLPTPDIAAQNETVTATLQNQKTKDPLVRQSAFWGDRGCQLTSIEHFQLH